MSTTWREKLLANLAEEGPNPDFETDAAATADEFDSAARRFNLEALRELDPMSSYAEELRIHLASETYPLRAALPASLSTLLPPVQSVVANLAEKTLELELSEVSAGSTVLHFRARETESEGTGEVDEQTPLPTPVDETPLATAARALLELVNRLENHADAHALSVWKDAVLELGKFTDELQKVDAYADFAWFGRSGEVRRMHLTQSGVEYLDALRQTKDSTTSQRISGRITELKESGHAKVKTGTQRNAPAYDVRFPPGKITQMGLTIGESVHWLVNAKLRKNGLGEVMEGEYTYVGPAPDEPAN
ncbi:hypothetical protein [Sediminivirga luteola]|uniref:Uncharacterized protein n=1 Tax=Sediminivirga luteola TaxID=1774748 RepID=A0A8J2XKM1_9MICO|nr:hypothetical protein [Sediminivirga luteola]GGA11118.1 hypothetical protein GCM10011333_12450 [Sediminivirga luteola]